MMHACCSMAFIEIKNEMSCIVYLKSFTCTGYNEITGFTSKTINCVWKKLSKLADKLHIK